MNSLNIYTRNLDDNSECIIDSKMNLEMIQIDENEFFHLTGKEFDVIRINNCPSLTSLKLSLYSLNTKIILENCPRLRYFHSYIRNYDNIPDEVTYELYRLDSVYIGENVGYLKEIILSKCKRLYIKDQDFFSDDMHITFNYIKSMYVNFANFANLSFLLINNCSTRLALDIVSNKINYISINFCYVEYIRLEGTNKNLKNFILSDTYIKELITQYPFIEVEDVRFQVTNDRFPDIPLPFPLIVKKKFELILKTDIEYPYSLREFILNNRTKVKVINAANYQELRLEYVKFYE